MGNCDSCLGNLIVTINYLKSDLIKKQRAFKIGLVAIFLVVFFLSLLLNAIELCSCIFIKLTEEQTGEIDLIFTPYLNNRNVKNQKSGFDNFFYNKTKEEPDKSINFANLNFLNFYDVQKKLENLSYIEGVAPRWIITGHSNKIGERDKANYRTNIFILESLVENNIGIGRELYLPDLKENECYVSTTLSDALKLGIGDQLEMKISLSDLLQAYSAGDQSSEEDEDEPQPEPQRQNIDNNLENNKYFYHELKNQNGISRSYLYDDDILNMSEIFPNLNLNFENDDMMFKNKNYKNMQRAMINSYPMKDIISNFIRKYINKNINNQINNFLEKINQNLPDNINLNELDNLSIKKSHLMNPLLKNIPYIKTLTKILFPEEFFENDNKKENIFIHKIIYPIIRQVFIYNKTTDLISLDKNILSMLKTGNIPSDFKYNIDYENILEQIDPGPIFNNITKYLNFKLNLTIRETIKSTGGKWPSASGNVIAFDSKFIKQYLYLNAERIVEEIIEALDIEYMRQLIWNYINNFLSNFDINNYALTINAIFKDKFDIYKKNQKSMRHQISDIAGEITNLLGDDYQINIQAPLYQVLATVDVAKLFLQDIFIGIMFFLWILCILLVYSLMLGNVDERTYEFGMMRSLGFKKNNLILLIIFQGFIFAVPGTILGLTTAYIANNFVAFLFNQYTSLVMPFFLSSYNIIFGIAVGLSIPLISSYFPIKKSLEDNLRETLAIFNKKIGDLVVSIIKLENLGVSPTTLIAAITLIIIGFLTYYMAPISFLLFDIQLFLFIMIAILITMLLGLIILTQLLVPYLQKLILKIIMFFSFKDRNLHLIVIKNLEGHKRRDQQVSIMFMVALGFVIFSGCTLNLVVDFAETLSKGLIGGDFSVYVTTPNGPNLTLNEIGIKNYLNNIQKTYPDLIEDYAFISYMADDLISNPEFKLTFRIATLSGFPTQKRRMKALDKSFLDSTYISLYTLTEYDKTLNISKTKTNKIDINKMLYDNPNIPKIIQETNDSFIYPQNNNRRIPKILSNFQLNIFASEGIRKSAAIGVDNPAQLSFTQRNPHSIPCKVIGMVAKLPGVRSYSSYNTLARNSEVYISMDQMKQLINIEKEIYNVDIGNTSNKTINGIRKRQMILKYKENSSKELKDMVFFAMNNYIEGLDCFCIQLDDIIEISAKVKNIIGYIFLVLGIIALILSFFLIWTSFYSNIRENIAEYGIMRSIGITKSQSVRIYLYEAATIILSSIIIGTFIGVTISVSLILQFDVFLELPFVFNFPFQLYFILIFIGLGLGLLGSYYPTYAVNTLSLVKIMKGFNE